MEIKDIKPSHCVWFYIPWLANCWLLNIIIHLSALRFRYWENISTNLQGSYHPNLRNTGLCLLNLLLLLIKFCHSILTSNYNYSLEFVLKGWILSRFCTHTQEGWIEACTREHLKVNLGVVFQFIAWIKSLADVKGHTLEMWASFKIDMTCGN